MKCLSLFLLIFVITSCNSITGDKPSGTLSEDALTDILIDMHLTEAKMRVATDSLDLIKLRDTVYLRTQFSDIFRKYEITPDKFNNSLDYYLKHIDKLDLIYDEVISRLTMLEAEARKKDSIANPKVNKSKLDSKADSISKANSKVIVK